MKDEVLRLVNDTFEGLLEALRDEVMRSGRCEHGACGGYYRYGYKMTKFLGTSWRRMCKVPILGLSDDQREPGDFF
jgi:hypothetical protein